MSTSLTSAPPANVAVERIRKYLEETLLHLDNPDADLGSSPLIALDVTTSHPNEDLLVLDTPDALIHGLDDVSQLLINLALRYHEQVALLKTNHTSALLKHQVESRRLNDKLVQDQKAASVANDSLQNAKAENNLLQEQLRQEQLTSSAKIDVLHQKIMQLESSLHLAQQKLQQNQLSGIPTPASSSPSPSENTPQIVDDPSVVASSETPLPSTTNSAEGDSTSLERYVFVFFPN